jgi:endonuclease III
MSSASRTGSRAQPTRGCRSHQRPNSVSLSHRATKVAARLAATFGSPNHDNKPDPLDELVFIMLSQMTTHHSFRRVYERLKQKLTAWEQLLELPLDEIKALIADAGLSNQKAPRLKAILQKVKDDFGSLDLSALASMSNAHVECYLTSLPGVGIKTAKCVMLYSLDRQVLPVDTHVQRVAHRLGLLSQGVSPTKVHAALEEVVPPASRYSFHVNAIALGRAVCVSLRPHCTYCPIQDLCPFPLTN